MPRKDGSGPMGQGSMTGRKIGYCAIGEDKGQLQNPGGVSYGFRKGCGFNRMFNSQNGLYLTNKSEIGVNKGVIDEKNILKNQANLLERQLENIKKRLVTLDKNLK